MAQTEWIGVWMARHGHASTAPDIAAPTKHVVADLDVLSGTSG
jgi:hypothetical protein